MSGSDGEFDDFLARRKPVFRRDADEPLEPPAELDRIVLRQAREAIRAAEPEPAYHGARWGMPMALAATVLIALTVVLHVGMSAKQRVPEVTVQNVSQPMASPVAEPMAADTAAESSDAPVVNPSLKSRTERMPGAAGGFVASEESQRYAPAPPAAAASPARPASASIDSIAGVRGGASTALPAATAAPPAEAENAAADASTPAWRHDAQSWLAKIERLEAEGKTAEAEAERAEFKRQHRAYAGAPDR